uniref:Tyr recombinase domain-containing protein n=1 Tax=Spongospora subterranea TaxID=70186 RepID=A0A0H5RIM8_9EUKA|eukprot:CRZ08549.1 hypothetical protein [Spongospora subterranea]
MKGLTPAEEDAVASKVQDVMSRMDLSLSATKVGLMGSRVLAANSSRQYGSVFRGLILFLKRIGDFASLVVFSENAPLEFCPSMSADSLMAYIDFKVLPSGTPLSIFADAASDASRVGPIRDYFTGTAIVSSGAWNDPGACNQLLSAVSNLHVAKNQGGPYQEPCHNCITLYDSGVLSGCRFHASRPQLWRCGSPRELAAVKNRYQRLTKFDLPDYQAQGNSALLPHELVDVRTALLSRNSISAFQEWVMVLFHVQLFLRAKEGCEFQLADFVPGLTTINRDSGEVLALGIKIKGKSDESFKLMMIWRNDQVPELCLVRHLLAWIHLRPSSTGDYLFPNRNGGIMEYNRFNHSLKTLFRTVIGRRGPWGTHTLRKTGYLMAIWGGGQIEQIMLSARHKTLASAQKYFQDAAALLHLAKIQRDNSNRVLDLLYSQRADRCYRDTHPYFSNFFERTF